MSSLDRLAAQHDIMCLGRAAEQDTTRNSAKLSVTSERSRQEVYFSVTIGCTVSMRLFNNALGEKPPNS